MRKKDKAKTLVLSCEGYELGIRIVYKDDEFDTVNWDQTQKRANIALRVMLNTLFNDPGKGA